MTRKSRISQYSSSKKTHVDLKNLPLDYGYKKGFHLIIVLIKMEKKKKIIIQKEILINLFNTNLK